MILCQNCLHKEMLGAMFCSECGAQLVYATGVPTSGIRMTTSNLRSKEVEPERTTVASFFSRCIGLSKHHQHRGCSAVSWTGRGYIGADERRSAGGAGYRSNTLQSLRSRCFTHARLYPDHRGSGTDHGPGIGQRNAGKRYANYTPYPLSDETWRYPDTRKVQNPDFTPQPIML